ncbi:hypothetical protein [Agrococcus sp. ARC_14]|uniref:hypothetical protein n=1 Tax=Agrococcus sp. ARC_14 TaxID=2919927 RepID=UPI001F06EF4A|nr:hypothetical protein [Agrococcus sp. ARC_14]MCH1881958.1 hypothetical protein [Agrococcus sp. ARC_14]
MPSPRRLATAMTLGVALGLALGLPIAQLGGEPAASAAVTTTASATSMTCDEILWEPVPLARADAASVFDQPRLDALGGLVCSWIDVGQEFVLAYAPVDAAQQAAAMADLETAGLTRVDSPEGVRFLSRNAIQASPLGGEHLFADGHWYAVQVLTITGDGAFIVPGTGEASDGVRTRVLEAVGASTAAAQAAPPAQPGAAGDPLSCDELGPQAVLDVIDPSLRDIDDTLTLQADDLGFDAQRFTGLGGTTCTWMVGQALAWVTFAYAPVDDEAQATATADLTALGLTRADTPEGVRFSHPAVEQAQPLDGQHLFADDHWFVVRQLSIGSGGAFIIDATPADADALRDRVLLALPPVPTATPAPAAQTPSPLPTEEPAPPLTADEPSVLSGLVPAGAAPVTVASVASTAGTALVLAALVAIPNRLVDLTTGTLADRARRRPGGGTGSLSPAERIRRLLRRIERSLHPVAGIAIGLIAAGALTALIDPRAGATLGTLRLAASATLGYAIEGLLCLVAVAWMLRRDGANVGVRFRPVSLLIVLGAIVVTRVVGFEPGFVFGVVVALVFLRPSPKHERLGALIELGYLAAIGIVAWLVYSAIQSSAAPTGPLGLLVVETLAGLTIGCLMALPLLLSPVGELPGTAIWQRSRLLWVAAFAVSMALVVWVVMPFPAAWDAVHTPVIAWVVLLAAYTLGAAALWVAVTKPFGRRADAVPGPGTPADGTEAVTAPATEADAKAKAAPEAAPDAEPRAAAPLG